MHISMVLSPSGVGQHVPTLVFGGYQDQACESREFSHRGGGYAEQKHVAENPPPCSELSTLPLTTPAASTESGDAAAETGAEDVLYGEDYVGDFMYKEDDLEQDMRREVICSAETKRHASFAGCLEFLKIICCLKF
ncbi:hypothetical protein ACFX14_041819 [Malus domestica]